MIAETRRSSSTLASSSAADNWAGVAPYKAMVSAIRRRVAAACTTTMMKVTASDANQASTGSEAHDIMSREIERSGILLARVSRR
jgi:hypothetical protein